MRSFREVPSQTPDSHDFLLPSAASDTFAICSGSFAQPCRSSRLPPECAPTKFASRMARRSSATSLASRTVRSRSKPRTVSPWSARTALPRLFRPFRRNRSPRRRNLLRLNHLKMPLPPQHPSPLPRQRQIRLRLHQRSRNRNLRPANWSKRRSPNRSLRRSNPPRM